MYLRRFAIVLLIATIAVAITIHLLPDAPPKDVRLVTIGMLKSDVLAQLGEPTKMAGGTQSPTLRGGSRLSKVGMGNPFMLWYYIDNTLSKTVTTIVVLTHEATEDGDWKVVDVKRNVKRFRLTERISQALPDWPE